ncbi:MAG TPA: N-acetylglucosamine-6-phosphate deacetylase [Ruminiclostridium sp.]|nr:N-acetylglucosamine-6-phosphate deacetylase [Ruminiclostridium sp.]
MDLFIRNGNVLVGGSFQKTNITVKNGRIFSLKEETNSQSLPELDGEHQKIVPGFIDIHTHGGMGADVNHSGFDDLHKISRFFASQGTTCFLASILTDTEEKTLWCIHQAAESMDSRPCGAQLIGIHLEGPFLSSAYKGAMPEALLIKSDLTLFKKYQEAAGGHIKYITVSPEVEGVPEMIPDLVSLGVVVALGHSGADYETAMTCIKNGATASTHTFNAMKLMHQHAPAISGAALESDIYCEAICDGRHLHPGIIRLLLKTKGLDRVVAVTDSIMAAGLPDGRYKLGVNDVFVKDGDAKLLDGTRAGSTLTAIQALKNLIQFTGRSLEELIPLLTSNPAKLLHIDDRKGSIALDKDADLVLLDNHLNISATIIGGEVAYRRNNGL